MLVYVLHLVSVRVPPAVNGTSCEVCAKGLLDPRARHALRAVQLAMTELTVQEVVSLYDGQPLISL